MSDTPALFNGVGSVQLAFGDSRTMCGIKVRRVQAGQMKYTNNIMTCWGVCMNNLCDIHNINKNMVHNSVHGM